MSFLFTLFFAPIMPIGLIGTLIARLLEVRFKATKLLFVRRRDWPESAGWMHRTQDVFTHFAVILAVFWHTGLVLIPYNTKSLQLWGFWRTLATWLGASIVVAVLLYLFNELIR